MRLDEGEPYDVEGGGEEREHGESGARSYSGGLGHQAKASSYDSESVRAAGG
jgi:hypothetical protein